MCGMGLREAKFPRNLLINFLTRQPNRKSSPPNGDGPYSCLPVVMKARFLENTLNTISGNHCLGRPEPLIHLTNDNRFHADGVDGVDGLMG